MFFTKMTTNPKENSRKFSIIILNNNVYLIFPKIRKKVFFKLMIENGQFFTRVKLHLEFLRFFFSMKSQNS